MMKRFVRSLPWQGMFFGLSSLLLVGIVEQETAISYLVVFGLMATMAWQSWARRRRDKDRAAQRKPS
jgi:hypothetical protein